MPQITAAAIMQLTLLLSALPAQYLISKWTGGSAAQRLHATKSVLKAWGEIRKSYLNLTAWIDWMSSRLPRVTFFGAEEEETPPGEPLPFEMMLNDNDFGYFAASNEVRSPRPEYVLHRVGEVIMEKNSHMVGVIVGWDAELRAPPEWIKREGYTDSEPNIPMLQQYFTHFDGKKFVMQEWLEKIYPDD
ncbi:uncharacterized protein LOC115823148 isoform X2 [Chanos chanos]|uniref:Uncharacterized protein LOC115823148 isoform X2 n=1 Tax=Chanos chanos TaxID=29144 RepID=A0A6J2WFJ6_CHACN|nr:uncharacterized protein LOC115823148 isoform X2 [Chanos chanos]